MHSAKLYKLQDLSLSSLVNLNFISSDENNKNMDSYCDCLISDFPGTSDESEEDFLI